MNNTPRVLVLVPLLVLASACSGAKLKKDMEETRGYPAADIQAIMEQAKEYQREMIAIGSGRSAASATRGVQVDQRLTAIFCNCVKKIGGERCRARPDGLAGDQKALWIKANAVDMAYAMGESAVDVAPPRRVDPDECQ